MGRFTQEDPIGLAGGLNLYGFANGDPVNFTDPFGLMACDPPGDPDCPVAKLSVSLGLQPVEATIKGPLVGALKGSVGPSAKAILEVTITPSGIQTHFDLSTGVSAQLQLGSAEASGGCQLTTRASGCGAGASIDGVGANSTGGLEVGAKAGIAGAKASFNPANAIHALFGDVRANVENFIDDTVRGFNNLWQTLGGFTTPRP